MSRKVKNKARSKNRAKLREALLLILGGQCSVCSNPEELEIDHVDGCTWEQRKVNAETRLYRYLRELREGVRLRVLCRSCNGALNQHTHGTKEERCAKDTNAYHYGVPF